MAVSRKVFIFLAFTFCVNAISAANQIDWIHQGQSALKNHQDDLAKGCFDQAIKFSGNSQKIILHVGLLWFENGRLEAALPYLLPNLSGLNSDQLGRLEKTLEEHHHISAAIMVLRHHASRSKRFSPQAVHAAELAFSLGQLGLCREILLTHVNELDSANAVRLLRINFYTGMKLNSDVIHQAALHSSSVEGRNLAALNASQQRNFKDAKSFLNGDSPLPIRGYVSALEQDAADQTDDAVESFKTALDSKWPEFRIIVTTEFFKHYSLTGNRYKVDQLWDEIKGQGEYDTLPELKEFFAYQLGLRGYEKQSKYLYRSLYHTNPDRPEVLKALWSELVADDSSGLDTHIQALLAFDSLDCDANLLAMRYAKAQGLNQNVVHHGRNAVLYCSDVVEPYLDVGNSLLAISRPDEARIYYAKYVRHGGDRNRVPTYMR